MRNIPILTIAVLLLLASPTHAQSDRELAAMANAVYDDRGGTPPKGWKIIQFASHSGGYAGAIYKKEGQDLYVVAHRGTDGSTDAASDYSIFKKKIPPQFYRAEEFVRAATDKHGIKGKTITHTGHSLGGFLAELCSADSSTRGSRSVTFENPGTNSVINSHPRFVSGNSSRGYMAAPNLVNTANRQSTRDLYRVYPPHTVPSKTMLGLPNLNYGMYTKQQHSMSGILSTFDRNTGEPYFRTKIDVNNWPNGVEAGLAAYKSYQSNELYWDLATRQLTKDKARAYIDKHLGGLSGRKFRPAQHTIGDTKNGRGMTVWPLGQGYYEQGNYKNGVAQGRAVHFPVGSNKLSRFGGDFAAGRPIAGRADYPNGDFAVGQFRNGAMHGNATYFFRNSQGELSFVKGEFNNHQLSSGELKFKDGTRYIGGFKTNPTTKLAEPNGAGKIEFPSGRTVEGRFEPNGSFNGKVIFENGDRFEGALKDGLRNGEGTHYFKSGGSVSGGWKNDKAHGQMRHNFKNGYYHVAKYQDGKKVGDFTLHRPDGSIVTPQIRVASPQFNWWRRKPFSTWYVGPGGAIPRGPTFTIGISF